MEHLWAAITPFWLSSWWYAYFLRKWVKSPSVHSLVLGSRTPYSSSLEMALGSMTWATPSTPSSRSRALSRERQAVLLPLPLGPTIIRPWFRLEIWYSCRTCRKGTSKVRGMKSGFILNGITAWFYKYLKSITSIVLCPIFCQIIAYSFFILRCTCVIEFCFHHMMHHAVPRGTALCGATLCLPDVKSCRIIWCVIQREQNCWKSLWFTWF